jgi:hypothetical protein
LSDDLLTMSMEIFTFVGILVAAGIFGRLAIKAKSIGSFRFQLSVFILIWAVAEVLYVGQDLGLFNAAGLDELGLAFHFASMAAFAVFIGLRSFKFLKVKPTPLPPPPVKPVPFTGAMEK